MDEVESFKSGLAPEKGAFAAALNRRTPKHVGLEADESFVVKAEDGKHMAMVLRDVIPAEDDAELEEMRTAHENTSAGWGWGCEADPPPDFERISHAFTNESACAGWKTVEGFSIKRIYYRSEDQCALCPCVPVSLSLRAFCKQPAPSPMDCPPSVQDQWCCDGLQQQAGRGGGGTLHRQPF